MESSEIPVKNTHPLVAKYPDLPGSKPVERAVQKGLREGKRGPNSKEDRTEMYLDRINRIITSGNGVNDERGWDLFKSRLIKEFIIKDDPESLAKISHGLYESEKKLAIEQGRGADIERLEQEFQNEGGILEKYKGLVGEKRDIQERTLTNWLDYLKQNDAQYPMWFRYCVVRELRRMGTIDKEKGEYAKRTPYTVAPFPELNSEALGFTYRMLTQGVDDKDFSVDPNDPNPQQRLKELQEKRQKLEKIIEKKDFARLYTFAQIETAGKLNRESSDGKWMKYSQKSDYHVLENALRGKGTGWCTAEGSAYAHLQGGDFYVYYTRGSDGNYTEPRIAIRMENEQVAEVRGVNHRQELESAFYDTASEQYHSLPGGDRFDKKSADMKKMTELVRKQGKGGEPFTKDEITFLYEIDNKIEGFGYDKDPRIAELRLQRNPQEDMSIVFGCEKSQIARNTREINENTKAYAGPLVNYDKDGKIIKIFDLFRMYHVENVFTSFPEGKIRFEELTIGGKTKEELKEEIKKKANIYSYAEDMMDNKDFTTLKNPENFTTVRLKVEDLGFEKGHDPTTNEVFARAQELGLNLCPAEVGPHQRLKDISQSMGDSYYIAMKQITDRHGGLDIFGLGRNDGGLWLRDDWTGPDDGWDPEDGFVFGLGKQDVHKLSPLKKFVKH